MTFCLSRWTIAVFGLVGGSSTIEKGLISLTFDGYSYDMWESRKVLVQFCKTPVIVSKSLKRQLIGVRKE